jgi:hypothetical protein
MGGGGDGGMCNCGKPWSFKTNYSVHLRSVIHSSLPLVYLTSLCCILPHHLRNCEMVRWLRAKWTTQLVGRRGTETCYKGDVMFVCMRCLTPCVPTLVAFQFAEFIDHKLCAPNAAAPKTYGMVYSVRFQSSPLYCPRRTVVCCFEGRNKQGDGKSAS